MGESFLRNLSTTESVLCKHQASPAVSSSPSDQGKAVCLSFGHNIIDIGLIESAEHQQSSLPERGRVCTEVHEDYVPVDIGQKHVVMTPLKKRGVTITRFHFSPDTIQLRIVEGRLCRNSVNVNAIDRRSPHFAARIASTPVPHPISMTTWERMAAALSNIDSIIIYVVSW